MHNDYLAHYGVKGMKWGVRRYQKKDGSLTPTGKKRYKNYEYTGDKEKDKFFESAASLYEKKITSPSNKRRNELYEKLYKNGDLSDKEFKELDELDRKINSEFWDGARKIENDRFEIVGRGVGSIYDLDIKQAKLGKEWLYGDSEKVQLYDRKTNETGFVRYATLGEKYVMLDSYWEKDEWDDW